MEVKVRPGLEPPPQMHEREHDLFFVLEGAIRFKKEPELAPISMIITNLATHAYTVSPISIRP
jgi:mannose-6-phosphate isomerase-like protein (cupin superfamily)